MVLRRFLVVGLCLGIGANAALAQSPGPASYVINATAADESLVVDGHLDEAVWKRADVATGFLQFEPTEGPPSSQRTEVRVLYGNGSIYVGAVLFDDDPAGIERALGRRDEYNRADWFIASFDSYLDRRTAYMFGVNAAGVQYDAIRTSGGGGGPGGPAGDGIPGADPSWDAIWHSEVRLTPQGWTIEIRIPYSMLRFSDAESQTWGVHFLRRIPRLGELSEWPLVPRTDRANLVARFGELGGIDGVSPRRNLQLRPYTVGQIRTEEDADEPGALASDGNFDVGGDLKVGLGPNVTLDATINPDFGQVESDPAVLNLTAFETFFDERRPFFVEGIQIYQFSAGPGALLYTRRIGADAPIVGATKLSGRTAEGLSFGLLGATTGQNFEPDQHYGVARVSRQIGDFSSAGAIGTLFNAPSLGGNGRRTSVVGGADWDIRFLDNRYGIEGFASVSHRQGLQNGETETGVAGKVWLRRRPGAWKGFVGLDVFGDTFNPNDVGQLGFNNFVGLLNSIEHDVNGGQPFGPFLRASVETFTIQQISFSDGLNQGISSDLSSTWTLRGFQEIGLSIAAEHPFGGYDIFETRGLGPWKSPRGFEMGIEIQTDSRRSWLIEPEVGFLRNSDGGRAWSMGLRGEWNAGTRLSLSSSLDAEWEDGVTAWSSNETFARDEDGWLIGRDAVSPDDLDESAYVPIEDGGVLDNIFADVEPFAPGFWYRPVFGERDTRSVDLTVRSTVTFAPTLSLQLYSQLFFARGRYEDFKILRDEDRLADFSSFPKRDDFSFSSLQSNLVLRWEYRPGSALFLVWTHGRRADDVLNPLAPWGRSPYERGLGDQIGNTFDIFPTNVFVIKLDYTFLY